MKGLERFTFEKVKREASAQRRPARIEQKNSFFPRNDRPYVLEGEAFQAGKDLSGLRRPQCQALPRVAVRMAATRSSVSMPMSGQSGRQAIRCTMSSLTGQGTWRT